MSRNGYLADSELRAVPWQTSKRVSVHIYDSLVGFGEAFKNHFGHYPVINSAYRDYDEQVYLFGIYGYPRSAHPGTSNHGWGRAIDWKSGIEVYGSPQWGWVNTRGRDFGFRPLNERNKTFEPWHWQNLTSVATSNTNPPGDIVATLDDEDHAAIRGDVLAILREQEIKNLLTGSATTGAFDAGLRLWREPEISNVIATNAERAVLAHPATVDVAALAAAIVAALPPLTGGITQAQVQAAVEAGLRNVTFAAT